MKLVEFDGQDQLYRASVLTAFPVAARPRHRKYCLKETVIYVSTGDQAERTIYDNPRQKDCETFNAH